VSTDIERTERPNAFDDADDGKVLCEMVIAGMVVKHCPPCRERQAICHGVTPRGAAGHGGFARATAAARHGRLLGCRIPSLMLALGIGFRALPPQLSKQVLRWRSGPLVRALPIPAVGSGGHLAIVL
jgi:hypothetical protein